MLAFLLAAALTGGSCANPTILSTSVQSVTDDGGLNRYTLAIVVQNLGTIRQPSDLLQSVDVFEHGERVDRIGLQPLRPKQSQKVTYSFTRSVEAGDGTTDVTFVLDFNRRSGSDVDCHAGIETTTLRV